jgi:hypothetical protein
MIPVPWTDLLEVAEKGLPTFGRSLATIDALICQAAHALELRPFAMAIA